MNKLVKLAIFVVLFLLSDKAEAQNPIVPPGVDGYTISIRDSWVANTSTGFRPVRVTIETNPAKATVVNEKFRVSVLTRQYSGASRETSTEVVIPAGQKSGVAEIYVHDLFTMSSHTNQLTIINEQGRELLSERAWAPNNWSMQPPTLIIRSDFPEIQSKQRVCYKRVVKPVGTPGSNFTAKNKLPSFNELNRIYNAQNATAQPIIMPNGMSVPIANTAANTAAAVSPWMAIASNPKLQSLPPSDLPLSWIGLQGVEQIMISLGELESLSQNFNLQRDNLEKWVTAGGVLIVYDTGPRFAHANDTWKFLLGGDREHIADRKLAKWGDPTDRISRIRKLIPTQSNNTGQYYDYDQSVWIAESQSAVIPQNVADWPTYDEPSKIPVSAKFAICDYLQGRIVAVDDDMSSWKQPDWRRLHNAIAVGGIGISKRVAVSSRSQDSDVTFSIPGVGEPPTKSFQVLIGLFLLIAGPVMMVVLKRTEQMQYLFVLVPLLSLGVCFSLFFYAVILDGSNRWGRVNSVTYLDHRTNQAVTHTHASYYSGVHPRSYQMQPDSLGIALERESGEMVSSAFQDRVMVLSGGSITARVPHEVATVCPQSATERLVILASDESNKNAPPKVRNLLGADVKYAMITTDKGLFEVNNLTSGAEATATKVSSLASQKAVQLVNEMSPEFVGGRSRNYDRRYYGNFYDQVPNYGEEDRLVALIRDGKEMKKLLAEPGTYLAILEEFPLAAKQVEPVEYKLQLHIVCGKWK